MIEILVAGHGLGAVAGGCRSSVPVDHYTLIVAREPYTASASPTSRALEGSHHMSDTGTLPGWLTPANRVVKFLHRLGVPLGTIHIITIPGRTTGEPRSTPVSPLTVHGRRYVIAGLAGSGWAKNARAAGRGRLAKGRRQEEIDLIEITDPVVRRQVMTAFPTEVPHGVQFFIRIGLVNSADPADFAAASDKVTVFEVRHRERRQAES